MRKGDAVSRVGVRIRPAELRDAPELGRLARATSSEASVLASRGIEACGQDVLVARIAALIADPSRSVLVAVDDTLGEHDDQIVGLLVARPDEFGALDLVSALQVSHVIVRQSVRRRGVGRALLAAVVHVAEERGYERIVVAVTSNSREANRYFARLGFAPVVTQRAASTAALRRSLGISDAVSRAAALRAARLAPLRRARIPADGLVRRRHG
jgi:ribosomal protein S18 acetylase RimI-like enzyme